MTPEQLRYRRLALGLSTERFARFVGLAGAECDRTVRRWERGDRAIPGAVRLILDIADAIPDARRWLLARSEKNRIPPQISD